MSPRFRYEAHQMVLWVMGREKGAFKCTSSLKRSVLAHTESEGTHLSPRITRRNTHTHTERRTSWGPGWSCWAGCGGAPWPLWGRSTPRRQRWPGTRWCPGNTARWTPTDTRSDWSHSPTERQTAHLRLKKIHIVLPMRHSAICPNIWTVHINRNMSIKKAVLRQATSHHCVKCTSANYSIV